jgi:beta-glucosidase
MFINGELVSHQKKEASDSMAFFLGVQDEHRFQYNFDASKEYDIVIESIPSQVDNSELFLLDGVLSVHLGFVSQQEMEKDLLAEAVTMAKEADLAICFVGNTTQWETEGQDMASMTLPANGSQDKLIANVAEANPNTVVVITTGVPVELPWLDKVQAVLQAWYGGQESGNMILDVLLGEVNPSGKLPVSWPRKYEHTSCYGNFGLDSYESRQVEYVEGVNVGYRHFDRTYGTDKQVLYPFGFGLSYSQFELSDSKVSGTIENDKEAEVKILLSVLNTSERAGAETVQVYLAPPSTGDRSRPPQSLVAFEKVFLQPGEKKQVELSFKRDGAAYFAEGSGAWRIDGGVHELRVSTSSNPADVKSRLPVEVENSFEFAV